MIERKMERLAEVRSMYDGLLKNLKPDKQADRIEKLRTKKAEQLAKATDEIRAE